MARSPQGRSAVGDEAARTLSEASSVGSGSGGSSGSGSGSGSARSSATTAGPTAATLPDVTYGKVLNVPDNLLGAGFTGKGWTIDEAVMEGGKPVVKLHRRVGNTGRIQEHKIDAKTYARAKAYRERQTGMAKTYRSLALSKSELGHPLDPQRDVTPDKYDAATRSYRVKVTGSLEPQWISEDIVREVKQGRPGSLQKLRQAAGLGASAPTSATNTVGQAVAGAVAGAFLGKKIATSLGFGNKNAEKSLDRPSTSGSTPQSATTQAREANRAANNQPEDRAAQERQARDQHLRRLNRERSQREEEEAGETTQAAPNRGAVAYGVTNAPGESSKVEVAAATSGAQAFSTTASTSTSRSKSGTRLTVDETPDAQATEITHKDTETEQTNVSDTSQNSQASYQTINRPLSAGLPGGVSSQPTQQTTDGRGASQPTSQPDRVRETLQRSEARRQRRQGAREKTTLRSGAPSLEPVSSSSPLGTAAPQPLGRVELTETETSIRQMRELMQAQAQDRNFTITSRVKANIPNSNVGSGFSLPNIASGSSSQSVRVGGASSNVGALASAVAVAGAGAGQLLASAGSRALTLQAARGAAQAIVSMEGTRREEALQRIQSTLEAVDLQIQATSRSLLQTPASGAVQPRGSGFASPVRQLPSREAIGSANAGGQVRVTASSTIPTPQDLSLLQQSAGTLRQAQAGVSALPAGAVIPQNFSRNIPGVELLIEATAPQLSETDSDVDTDTQALQRFASSFSPRQEAASSQSVPPGIESSALPSSTPSSSSSPLSVSPNAPSTQTPAVATQGIRVGAPPVPRRRAVSPSVSQGVGPQHVGGRAALSAPLASAVNLNAAQARDQRAGAQAGGQDAREDALAQDTSIPTDTNTSAPVAPLSAGYTSGMSSEQDTEEAEDTLATTGEQAQEMREQADKTRATGEQFSGAQNPASEPESNESPSEESQPSPQSSSGLSQEQQLRAGILLGAAQERKQQEEKETKEKASPTSSSSSKSKGREKSFQERLTKGKLFMDLIEGCFDALGFLEFLAESTLGILNDRYFKLNSLPTLKGIHGGPEDRIDRNLRRGVIFVDIYLFIVLFMGACVVVALIVAIVGGVGGAAGTTTPATPGASPGIVSWGLDS